MSAKPEISDRNCRIENGLADSAPETVFHLTPLPSPLKGRNQTHHTTNSLPSREELGIGQTDTPINHHNQGEVLHIPFETFSLCRKILP